MKKYITIAAAALVALAACTDEEVFSSYETDPNAVRIRATVGEMLSRSNPTGDATTSTKFNQDDQIAVSTDDGQGTVVYTFDGTNWTPEAGKYLKWNNASHTFTAYYPANKYTGTENVPTAQNGEEGKAIAAADFMSFAKAVSKAEDASLEMAMVRQTARIVINSAFNWNAQYKEGDKATHQVTEIKVNCNGVSDILPYLSGNYYALVNPGAALPEATFITLTVEPVDGTGEATTHIVKGVPAFEAGHSYKYNLTIGKDGASISSVTVDDWSTGGTIEGGMDDDAEPYFYISKPQGNFTCVGGTKEYTIRSFITNGEDKQIGIPWTAKFVRKLDDGTYQEIQQGEADYPTWITGFVDKGIGNEPDQKISITVEPAEINNNHYLSLKSNRPVSGVYNLSNASGGTAIENTANCYIINASGSYSFPLVYGNAIKNGATNESAYKSGISNHEYALENFVNHDNMNITSPWIAENQNADGTTIIPHNAALVWQDSDNLVSNIQFVNGGSPNAHCITFDVAQATIKQGNAIIAIRDANNTILWSWHIWITDYKPLLDATVINSYDPTETQRDKKIWSYDNQHSFVIMGVPMGWCDAESAAGRETIIQYTQIETGDTEELIITQEPLSAGGNYVYYQWGRKDPMLGSDGFKYDKPYYASDYPFTKDGLGKATVGKTIQNPHIFYDWGNAYHREWCDNTGTAGTQKSFLYNLWDATNASYFYINNQNEKKYTMTVKTVYDPSPVGYVVPPNAAMNGNTYNGTNILNTWEQFNTPFTSMDEFFANKGMVFYCKGMESTAKNWKTDGGVIYYPAAGRRYEDGNLYEIGEAANFWTATPRLAANMYLSGFSFTDNTPGVGAMSHHGTVYGEAVRPIREQ